MQHTRRAASGTGQVVVQDSKQLYYQQPRSFLSRLQVRDAHRCWTGAIRLPRTPYIRSSPCPITQSGGPALSGAIVRQEVLPVSYVHGAAPPTLYIRRPAAGDRGYARSLAPLVNSLRVLALTRPSPVCPEGSQFNLWQWTRLLRRLARAAFGAHACLRPPSCTSRRALPSS